MTSTIATRLRSQKSNTERKDSYHHYVPRFILRYFARPQSSSVKQLKQKQINGSKAPKSNLLFLYNISTGVLEDRSISRAYGQVNLYRDTKNLSDVDHLEVKLAGLEGSACTIIRRIHDGIPGGQCSVSREELVTLRKFIFVMHYRSDAISAKYFQEDNPDNAPLSSWINRYKDSRHLKDAVDLWLEGLKYYLDTPHFDILATGERLRKRYGAQQLHDMLRKRLDPEIEEDYFAIDYESLANYFFLGIWEAAEGSEFILSGNTFGLWEGLIYGSPGAHRLYIVSPRIALILRRTFLRQMPFDDASVLVSRLGHIPITPPIVVHAKENALSGLEHADPAQARLLIDSYRFSKAALKDDFTFNFTKLTREQTYAVNEVIMTNANLHPEGAITFSSPAAMLETLKFYLSSQNEKHSLFQPLLQQLSTSDDIPASRTITTTILTDPQGFIVKRHADRGLYTFLQYVIGGSVTFPSSFNRAYLIYHMATATTSMKNPVSLAIRFNVEKAVAHFRQTLGYGPPNWIPKRTLVKTLSKEESEVFFSALSHRLDSLGIVTTSEDVLATMVHEATIVGISSWLAMERSNVLQDWVANQVNVLI